MTGKVLVSIFKRKFIFRTDFVNQIHDINPKCLKKEREKNFKFPHE